MSKKGFDYDEEQQNSKWKQGMSLHGFLW